MNRHEALCQALKCKVQCALVSALEKLVVLERQTSDERLEGNVEKTVTKTDPGPRGGREMVSTKPAREGCVGMSVMLAHGVCSGVCWTWGAERAPGVRERGAAGRRQETRPAQRAVACSGKAYHVRLRVSRRVSDFLPWKRQEPRGISSW